MRHKYRGYGYKLRIRHEDMLEYVVYGKGLAGWLGIDFEASADFTKDKDESEEGFIVDIHQKAQKYIDQQADKDDRNSSLKRLVKDNKSEFLGRLMK